MRTEQAVYWHNSDVGELDLLRATYVTHTFAPHSHEGYAIGVIMEGAEQFRYRRSTHVAPMGSMVLINPGEIHTGGAAEPAGWVYRMLYPTAELLQDVATSLVGRPQRVPLFHDPVVYDPALAQTLGRLHATLESEPDVLTRSTQLVLALASLVERHADSPHVSPNVARAANSAVRQLEDYLHAHLTEPVPLTKLAALAGVSTYHVVRMFQQATGLPPHAYLTQLRVQRARQLLATSLPVAAVAVAVGFYDQAHLTRHFKRIVGVPPGYFARQMR